MKNRRMTSKNNREKRKRANAHAKRVEEEREQGCWKEDMKNGEKTEANTGGDGDSPPRRRARTELVKENDHYEDYYRDLLFTGEFEDEVEAFKESIRTPLPTVFRLNRVHPLLPALRRAIHLPSVKALDGQTVEGLVIQAPRPIPWFPNQLAWEFNASRKQLRKIDQLKRFHQMLVSQAERGSLTRQEAVSMVPPLFLDCQPHHRVIDLCAAPGSKTTQILEQMLSGCEEGKMPTGVVVANDASEKRAFVLHHRTKALGTHNVVVTHHIAQSFPLLRCQEDIATKHTASTTSTPQSERAYYQFDRVLADVPCSGDGTLRKNFEVWKTWSPVAGFRLHKLQLTIALRAVQLLKPGGIMVYSTCSLSPLEDEAVVCGILRRFPGVMELVDVSDQFPNLRRRKGLNTWQVHDRDYKEFLSEKDLHGRIRRNLTPDTFAPSTDITTALHMDRCMRFLPHHQNTGGFFVAVLRKRPESRAGPLRLYPTAEEAQAAFDAQGMKAYDELSQSKAQEKEKETKDEEDMPGMAEKAEEKVMPMETNDQVTVSEENEKKEEKKEENEKKEEKKEENEKKEEKKEENENKEEKKEIILPGLWTIRPRSNKEAPFLPLVGTDQGRKDASKFIDEFGLRINPQCLVVRSSTIRGVTLISEEARALLIADRKASLNIVNMGLMLLKRFKLGIPGKGQVPIYRPSLEAAQCMSKFSSSKRHMNLSLKDFKILVRIGKATPTNLLSEEIQKRTQELSYGSVHGFVDIEFEGARFPYTGYCTPKKLSLMVSKQEIKGYIELLEIIDLLKKENETLDIPEAAGAPVVPSVEAPQS